MAGNSMRPGVFSTYTLTTLYGGGGGGKRAALLAPFAGEAFLAQSFGEAAARLTGAPREAARQLFSQGVPEVRCIPLAADADGEAAQAAVATLATGEPVYALVCSLAAGALAGVKEGAEALSQGRRECVAFCGMAEDQAAVAAAAALNSERVVLCAPAARWAAMAADESPSALVSAAALAGAVLGAGDPAASFSGRVLAGLSGLEAAPGDSQVEAMLAAGVTPLELRGGAVECVRALTTRTTTAGLPDRTFAPLGTVLIVDEVMADLRASLAALLQGARTTQASFGAIASQVTVLLQEKKDRGLLTEFAGPLVRQKADDPTVCLVEVAFKVAFAVNQIHIQAQITV